MKSIPNKTGKKSMFRARLLYLLCIFIIGNLLFLGNGCAKKEQPSVVSPAEEEPKKVFSWKLQSAWPPPEQIMGYLTAYGQCCEIARQVKERTNGGLDIKVYAPGALFKETEVPEAIKKNAIEMACSTGSYHLSILPEGLIDWGLPYAFKDSEQAKKFFLQTDFLKIMRQAYIEKHNVHLFGHSNVSSYNYITKSPIKSLNDLKGKKIRATGISAKIVAAHGAVPTNVTGSEQYMALQRGTIDGTLFPPYGGVSYKLFEVAKYQLWPPVYPVVTVNFLVNLDAWKSLPGEYQKILEEEIEKKIKYSFEVSGPALEKVGQEEGKKQFNSESIWLSEAEFAKFQEAVKPLWDEIANRSDYCSKIAKIIKEIEK